jgi:NAD+ kinase
MTSTDLVLSIGGDGTILRVARSAAPWGVPIAGINLGSVGFLTELTATDALERIPLFLSDEGWIDERAMIQAELTSTSNPNGYQQLYHALNDIVVGRGTVPRLIHIKTFIDGEYLTTYRTDGIIISTATGSTAYSLASGGPILYPQAKDMLLSPVSSYLSMTHTLILPSTATIDLQIQPDYQAVLSIDGQINLALVEGDNIKVKRSSHVTRFLRICPPSSFYNSLERRLREKWAY